ncbi:M81 family metallopeptidase [Leeia sp. TBRC 13508]|uniref:Microcystinase C n=1 Tax=Leeia speluncae TaxID=2884804 RepID=A0ABS8D3Y3_9NEIS|nr:M81 family metallopeptidase [Leeia speluncae]MCB6182884.1 M81 family metallopeptidase [Leeia speluncae]
MARIGIAGFLHETNTFANSRAKFVTFAEADAWPGLQWGEKMFEAIRGVNIPVTGFVDALADSTHTLVPLVWASANPSGPVTEDAFESITWMLQHSLSEAGQIDALFLDLHGAMATEHLQDGEGELLRRIRQQVGKDCPIIATLDFHANITPAMVEYTDALIVYRTYPHVDMSDAGHRAAALLPRLLYGERWHKTFRQLPFLIPMPWQCTLSDPVKSLIEQADQYESNSVPLVRFAPGFPLADVPDCAPSILVYSQSAEMGASIAEALVTAVSQARSAFAGKLWGAADAVAYAKTRPAETNKPLILADTQDNPGGGADSNSTDLIAELLNQSVSGCVGLLCDPNTALLAHQHTVGDTLSTALCNDPATQRPWTITQLGNGQFIGTGPFYEGCKMDLGPMVALQYEGVTVIVSSRKQQAADQAMFRHLGVEPAAQPLLVLKSSVHFRADFGEMASEILVVAASGPNTADLHELTYQFAKRPPA